jgi:HSP20 family molecular chaperone IbpA
MFTLDLIKFYETFPNYRDFQVPMWSDYKETDDKLTVKVVVPGHNKKDFDLFVKDNTLFLDIVQENKKTITYSVIRKFIDETYLLDKATAEYVSGILKITIPRDKSERKSLSITIK